MRQANRNSIGWTPAFLALFVLLASIPKLSTAQPYISSKGGLVNVIEGQADVHNAQEKRWEKARPLLQLRPGDELRTRDNGQAEVLLNPGSFVRLGAESSVRIEDNRLIRLSLVLLSGTMEVEAGNIKIIKQIQVSVEGRPFAIAKDGIYRFDIGDSGSASARVFRGEMRVTAANGKSTKMKKSSMVVIGASGATLAFSHFDTHLMDSLSEWAAIRSQQLARANHGLSSSYASGYYGGYYGGYFGFNSYLWGGGWFYDPIYGYYTFMPGFGSYYSPYGWNYYPPVIIGGGGGSSRRESSGRSHESLSGGFGQGQKDSGRSYSPPSSGPPATSAPSGGGFGRSEGGSGQSERPSVRR
jgi:hypothetical protein